MAARRKRRSVVVSGDLAHIPLTRGAEALIDARFARLVEEMGVWHLGNGYAVRSDKVGDSRRTLYLHREIWTWSGRPECMEIDHTNRNALDCRLENLRPADLHQNARNRGLFRSNRTGLKGVHFCNREQRWVARIRREGKPTLLGYFRTLVEAGRAYDRAAKEAFGVYAFLNFADDAVGDQ